MSDIEQDKSGQDAPAGMKFCPDCGEYKPLSEFYQVKSARYAGGVRYSAYCKPHQKQRNAKTKANAPEGSKTREAQRRANRAWAAKNPEANRQAQARWRERHPEEAAERHREWQVNNPEANRAKARRHARKKAGGDTTTES